MTSVVEICRAAADELSVIRPTSVGPDAVDPTAQKLFRHLTRTCRQLSGRYDWQKLRRERSFTTVSAAEQEGALPSDFLRFVKDTMFNRTRRTKVMGPLAPIEWQRIQATVFTGVYSCFIQRGDAILLTGTYGAGESIAFEYITKSIGVSEDGLTEREAFLAPSDTSFFDDELLISGIVWRYKKAEGDDYSEEFREHEIRFADLTKMDGGRRILDLNTPSENGIPSVNGGDIIVDLTSV